MSPVAAGLDGLLALLLILALALGLQLNARLKALRAGQADFAVAVTELNRAAERAEAGLAAIRTASEGAHDDLLARIEAARSLAGRLERVTLEAERAAERSPSGSGLAAPAGGVPTGGALAAIAALAADPRSPAGRAAEPAARPAPTPAGRHARPAFDDDLFEAAPGAGQGGRMAPDLLGALHGRKDGR